ncbi:putative membrane protein [Sagittula marina]|uniref:Putative membrane protein n=1 Tax=Sagittula marina TaxID=943940 RepID=A0A7W6GQU8_9RHOB|nr:SH3 domain-containing protein [Sagittula marina]MBB3983987.1 putative membrane protein [Sagittula marina]
MIARAYLMRLVMIFAALLGGAVHAQELPAMFDVTGVRTDDVLNVRSGPGVGNPVIGSLTHDETRVEVTAIQGNWARFNLDEGVGWASLRFLERRSEESVANAQGLRCFGTEPFWDLEIVPEETAQLRRLDTPLVDVFQVGALGRLPAEVEKYAMRGVGASREIAAVITPDTCTDGMSDRIYGLDATVFVTGSQGPTYGGCCSLTD